MKQEYMYLVPSHATRASSSKVLAVDVSPNISVECRSTYRLMLDLYVSLYVDWHISVDISTDSRPICRSTYPDRYSTNMSTDTSAESQPICRLIHRSRGAQNTHDPQSELSVADPDFELRRGPGFTLLAQRAFLPSVISSFSSQYKGGPGSPGSLP